MKNTLKIMIILIIIIITTSSLVYGYKYYNYNEYYEKAHECIQTDAFDKSIEYFNKALNYSTKNKDEINENIKLVKKLKISKSKYEQGVEESKNKEYIKAIELLGQVIKEDKNRYELSKEKIDEYKELYIVEKKEKAKMLANEKKYNDAIVELETIIEFDSKNAEAKELREEYLLSIKEIEEEARRAEEEARRAEEKLKEDSKKLESATTSKDSSKSSDEAKAVEKPVENKYGNSQANLTNRGIAAVQGDWIYYINYKDDATIYKVKTDGTQRVRVHGTSAHDLNVTGRYIRFIHTSTGFQPGFWESQLGNGGHFSGEIFETSTDSENSRLAGISLAGNTYICIVGDKIYSGTNGGFFTNGDGWYQRNQITTGGINYFIYKDYVYYIKSYDYDIGKRTLGIFRTHLESKETNQVLEVNTLNFNIYNDRIYYVTRSYHNLYSADLDGDNKKIITDQKVFNINVTDDWIYYVNESDENKLYKMKVDGSSNQKLSDDSTYHINVFDDFIVYSDMKTIYKIDKNGSNKVELK